MDPPPETGLAYLRCAPGQVLGLVELLGDPLLDEPATLGGTDAVGALVLHCCASCDLHRGAGVPHPARARLHGGVGDDDALLLHLVEELFQHLGPREVTKDVLLEARGRRTPAQD